MERRFPWCGSEEGCREARALLSSIHPRAVGAICNLVHMGLTAIALTYVAIRLLNCFFTRGAKKTYEALVPSRKIEIHGQDEALDPLPEPGEINLPINNKSARSAYTISQRFVMVAGRSMFENMSFLIFAFCTGHGSCKTVPFQCRPYFLV